MSDTSQGPGWWQASDGKWYAPQTQASLPPPRPPRPKPFALWVAIAAIVAVAGGAFALTRNDGGVKPLAPPASTTSPRSTSSTHSSSTHSSSTRSDSTSSDSFAECMSDFDDSDFCADSESTSTESDSWSTGSSSTESSSTDSWSTESSTPSDEFDVTSLIGQHAFDDAVDSVIRRYGCHPKQGAVGTNLCPSSGLIIEESITSDLIMGTTMVVSATSDESNPSSFQTFTGALPFGMSWSMTRSEVESMLIERYGQPVNFWDGGSDSYVSEDYTITGMNYAGLTVQFSNTTGTLIRVEATIDPPYAT